MKNKTLTIDGETWVRARAVLAALTKIEAVTFEVAQLLGDVGCEGQLPAPPAPKPKRARRTKAQLLAADADQAMALSPADAAELAASIPRRRTKQVEPRITVPATIRTAEGAAE